MPVAPCGYSMWEGARFTGLRPEGFDETAQAELPLTEDTLVHGWVRTVHRALTQLGVPIPQPIDYPVELHAYLGRNLYASMLGQVHQSFAENDEPVFVKPVQHKLFTGHTITRFSELAETTNIDMTSPVWVSSIVDFVAEYRCFVFEGGLMGIQRYTGDPWVLPNKATVIQMIKDYSLAPVAYALDVGVTRNGKTLLVEVNDMYSCGNYAFDSLTYSEMVVARWQEMVQQ